MFVCVARLVLQIPDSGSLKAKKQILRRVTDRVKARFNVAVSEVDDQDLWQKATVALAVVGNDRRHVDEQMSKIIHFVEEMYVAPLVSREMEIFAFGDKLYAPDLETPKDLDQVPGDDGRVSAEDLLAGLARQDRSLAEAEGLGEWERRHERHHSSSQVPVAGGPSSSEAPEKSNLDAARAKARGLRNPRDWEKK